MPQQGSGGRPVAPHRIDKMKPSIKDALDFANRLLDEVIAATDCDHSLMAMNLKFDNENELEAAINNLRACIEDQS